jgi:hypothetical protein
MMTVDGLGIIMVQRWCLRVGWQPERVIRLKEVYDGDKNAEKDRQNR